MNDMSARDERKKCPACGSKLTTTAVRKYPDMPGLVDVGWKCIKCNHEWGYEYLSEAEEVKRS